MFKLASNEQIGAYLKSAIDRIDLSDRQFGKRCLQERGESTDKPNVDRMAKRISHILNGNREVQLDDLMIFSKILNMSCEEILSAGKCFAFSSSRMTNYSIALSKDKKEWDNYINHKDQLILNADEYGKTVVDYALEFKNYDLLKYLTDNEYIWFVGENEDDFAVNFGAGTSIVKLPEKHQNMGILESRLHEDYKLRMKMIALAIEKGDIDMLDKLRAREIQSMYFYQNHIGFGMECEKYFDNRLIQSLKDADENLLKYFTTEFEVTDNLGTTNRYIFSYTDKLILALLETKNDYVSWVLEDAIKHNKYVLDELKRLFDLDVEYFKKSYGETIAFDEIKSEITKKIVDCIYYHKDGNYVSYRVAENNSVMISNIVRISVSSENKNLQRLIDELNGIYDEIKNISPVI